MDEAFISLDRLVRQHHLETAKPKPMAQAQCPNSPSWKINRFMGCAWRLTSWGRYGGYGRVRHETPRRESWAGKG